MFSKSCNLVFFFVVFLFGGDFTDFFGCFFLFLRIMSKAQVFQMFYGNSIFSNLGSLSLKFVVHEFQGFSIGIVSFEVLV